MNKIKYMFQGLHSFLLLWSTQALSSLGSGMTSYALVIWSYQAKGSALTTALLSVCTYAPYVVLSIFAGALSDKWNKKHTMLLCDSLAAASTLAVFLLLRTGHLEIWHLYVLNAFNGLMNTLQQPASDVAVSLLTPKEQYQRVGGMRSFSNSLVTVLTPVIATAILSLYSLTAVIVIDFITFGIAFLTLAFLIRIPPVPGSIAAGKASILSSAREGIGYLKKNRGILDMIVFLAAINLTASMYNAALPAMLLSREGGGGTALGLVNACTGLANLAGSAAVSLCPAPKSRVRAICNSLLFSMSTENFLLAFGQNLPVWCTGAVLGWLFIPVMSANMDVLFQSHIPLEMQGRVYSVRNTLQFFTIPVGYLLGGLLVDKVFEPLMEGLCQGHILHLLFGSGKGSGAAVLFLLLGILGTGTCLIFRRDRHLWMLEQK